MGPLPDFAPAFRLLVFLVCLVPGLAIFAIASIWVESAWLWAAPAISAALGIYAAGRLQ